MTIAERGRGAGQWLDARVVKGKLVISIGVDVLAFAAQQHFDEEHFQSTGGEANQADYHVVDPKTFAGDVCRELLREAEDGTNRLHRMFDPAFVAAMERGSEGIAERETEAPVKGDSNG